MSLSRRIWWVLVLTALGAVAMSGIAGWFTARSLVMHEIDQGLQQEAERFSTRGPGVMNPRIFLARRREGVEWRLVLANGEALRASPQWPSAITPTLALGADGVQSISAAGRHWRALQVPMRRVEGRPSAARERGRAAAASSERPSRWRQARGNDDRFAGAVMQVAIDVTATQRDLRALAWLLAGVGAVVTVVAGLLAGRLRDALLAPLSRLNQAIDKLDDDARSQRLQVSGLPQELAEVTGRLDQWLKRLAHTRERERRTLADIAHELRTPLATLAADVAFTRNQRQLPAPLAERLGSQIAVLHQRLEGLLLLTRMDAGAQVLKRRACPVAEAVAEAWAPLAGRAAQRGWQLAIADEDAVEVHADPTLLGMLLSNLLGNAIAHGAAPGVIQVTLIDTGQGVEMTLRNPAHGLPPGPLPDAFTAFWRGDQVRSGGLQHAGLGLAVVARIAQVHGAGVEAAVAEDGSFCLYLEWSIPQPANPGPTSA